MIRLADPRDHPGRAREFRCTVHGLCFENRYRLLEAIHAGDPLVLSREPDNAIGDDAIQVQTTSTQTIGYVPRTISRWLAPLMDSGHHAVASVVKIRSGCPYYERLLIEVAIAPGR
jgi:hypothetical protein